MNKKYKFYKIISVDGQPQIMIVDINTKGVMLLNKWDIWHLVDLVR